MTITETSGLGRDPDTEYEEICRWLGAIEFAWDIEKSLEFALFRTYAVPSISGLLVRTGKFEAEPRKRYDDTELLLSEPMEHGLDSDRGAEAVARINAIHGRFRISNDDMLYVLTTFVCEPVRWCARYAKRPFSDDEVRAWTNYYRALGARMGISGIPADYAALDALNCAYEGAQFRYAESNHRIAVVSLDLLLGFYLPRPLFSLARPAALALMDGPLILAMGFEPPSRGVRKTVERAMAARKWVLGKLPRRKKPRLITARRRPTYPGGYVISELGNGPLRAAE
ncbi:MAG: DUF2236 domain-containing protein [Maritimibacter sp.]|uniref:oxygenase MpaB family protein n=1 Tax=Maritimibacter sp. TaxID=2003363 RepID=UPI001DA4B308|nr:oxygenase MpaB family protein [Maritimibacter sp.]MBL6428685.1 DUF2236 domain-containing protein [Maritimibacter sp.]